MYLFWYQPELASTINVIFGQMIGPVSTVIICGCIFIVAISIGLLLYKRFSWKIQSVIAISLLIAWLPLAIQFFYSSTVEFSKIMPFIGAPESEQISWRYCRIDQEQHLGGGFCNMYSFTQAISQVMPSNSTVHILSSNVGIYLRYFLFGKYRVTADPAKADYIILYHSPEHFEFANGTLYRVENNSKESLGKVEVIGQPVKGQILFKRISN